MHYRAFVFSVLFASPALGGDWPAWRGPTGNGVSPETSLPAKWSATENVRWKAALPGVGVSAPIVHGERVFITASDGRRNERLHILCFDRQSGKKLWQAKFFGSI